MIDCFSLVHNFFQIGSVFVLFLYTIRLISSQKDKCDNDESCIETNWKLLLLFDFLYQDVFFCFYDNNDRVGKLLYKYFFYSLFLLVFLTSLIFSINIYIDTFTGSYVLFMYLCSWKKSREPYEPISGEYPECEISSNLKTKRYYQSV